MSRGRNNMQASLALLLAGGEGIVDLPEPSLAPALPDQLRERLAAQAEAAGLLEVAYRTLESPLGTLLIARTDRGLLRVALPGESHEQVLAELAGKVGPRILFAPRALDRAAGELERYFAGALQSFSLDVDLRLARGFRRLVLERLQAVPYGQTTSYAALADACGSPRAVRAVGSACARNPLPIVVPCHRVLRSDGSLGGYAGGLQAKRLLLALEQQGAAGRASRT